LRAEFKLSAPLSLQPETDGFDGTMTGFADALPPKVELVPPHVATKKHTHQLDLPPVLKHRCIEQCKTRVAIFVSLKYEKDYCSQRLQSTRALSLAISSRIRCLQEMKAPIARGAGQIPRFKNGLFKFFAKTIVGQFGLFRGLTFALGVEICSY
jgi:hypothetical protein